MRVSAACALGHQAALEATSLICPLFYEAAAALGDPVLLPAVLAAEEKWIAELEEGEEISYYVTDAVEALQSAAVECFTSHDA